MDLEEHQAEAKDKLLQANYGLWNALLTVNGITLAVFSALYTLSPKAQGSELLVMFLIGACAVSLCLIIFNHVAIKLTYHRIFEFISNPNRALTEDQKQRDIRNAMIRPKAVRLSEFSSLALFVLEIFCIAAFVWTYPRR